MVTQLNDRFSQRLQHINDQPESIEQPSIQEKTPNVFSKRADEMRELERLQGEELDPEIERHLARLTSRGIEQVGGLPGNIRDLAYGIKNAYQKQGFLPNEKHINKIKSHLPKISEPESFKKFEEAIPIASTVSNLLGYLPTSSDIKKFSEEKTGGYTKPQGETERIGDELFENLLNSALPGQGRRNIWRNIAAPVAGVLGKEGIKYLGGGEKSQALTQLGLNIAVPLMAGNAPQLNRDTWRNVRNTVPNVNIPTNNILQRAQNLRGRIQRGLGSRSENQATRTLDNLIEKLDSGSISADELMASNISLNEIVGDPELFGRGGHWFEEIRGLIRDGMEQVGQHAPDWYRQWQHANEMHGAIANSNYIANTIRKHSEPLLSEGARALFQAATHATAKAAGLAPPLYLIYKGTQVLNRMANSPQLMQYYMGVLTNSLRGNTAQAISNLTKLDEAFLKEENNPKPPFKTSSQKK